MPDNKTLVIGTFTQTLYTLDEETYAVIAYPAPNFGSLDTTVFPVPVAMANGKVLILGHDLFLENYGNHVVEWDFPSNTFTEITLPDSGSPPGDYNFVDLKRSSDHEWAFGGPSLFYSSAAESFSVGPVPNTAAVENVAANSKGTQFAAASGNTLTLYDERLDVTCTLSPSSAMFTGTNIVFADNDSRVYWQSQMGVFDAVDASNCSELGTLTIEYADDFPSYMLWVDSGMRAFLGNITPFHGGVGTVDFRALSPTPQGIPNTVSPNPSAVANGSSTPVILSNLPAEDTSTFGGQLPTVLSITPNSESYLSILVRPPSPSVAGPVDVVSTAPGGASTLQPRAFAYGLSLSAFTADLLPPIGTPVVGLFGFGLTNSNAPCPCPVPSVTVGGKPVLAIQNVTAFNEITSSTALNEFLIQLPMGATGQSSVDVTSFTGTASFPVTYIPAAQIVPANGLLSLLYDSHRSLLYALKSNEVDVFNPATMTWHAPVIPEGSSNTTYVAMTLTPDGSHLLIAGSGADTITIVNPDNPSQKTTASLPYHPIGIAATNTGKAFIPLDVGGGFNEGIVEFDLSGMTYSIKKNDNLGNILAGVKLIASTDGSYVAGAGVRDANPSTVTVWNPGNDSFSSQVFQGMFWTDVALSPSGTIAAFFGDSDGADILDEQLHFRNATVEPDFAQSDAEASQGAAFTPSGRTLVVPTQDSIEFFDPITGRLRDRLMTPELLSAVEVPPSSLADMAMDVSGQTIFAISPSGLTVMTLPAPADQLQPGVWP
jgi:hypothetical protein